MKKKILIFGFCFVVLVIFILASLKVYGVLEGSDTQCFVSHQTSLALPKDPTSAQDFFDTGNYYYDTGNCKQAVVAYTKAISLDTKYVQAYNNRGYTNMRLRNYSDALDDFTVAIALKPSYATAYLNRGDLYNYYGPIIDRQKAIADYQKAISLGAVHNTSVCGHLAMAQTHNLIPLAILKFVFNRGYCK